MSEWFERLRTWIRALADDALPMPSEQRAERDWSPEPDLVRSDHRRQRLRLHLLGKRGKGGYR